MIRTWRSRQASDILSGATVGNEEDGDAFEALVYFHLKPKTFVLMDNYLHYARV